MNDFTRMTGTVACLALLAGAAPAEQAIAVPTGQPVTLGEVLIDDSEGETWIRFRFIAPEIGDAEGKVNFEKSAPDMDYLCEKLALPYLAEYDLKPALVVISLSDRVVPFGVSNPAATQFFEAYRPGETNCIWESF